jgi:nitrate/TMAO reductase-like tetraheme cytochrome c subunit
MSKLARIGNYAALMAVGLVALMAATVSYAQQQAPIADSALTNIDYYMSFAPRPTDGAGNQPVDGDAGAASMPPHSFQSPTQVAEATSTETVSGNDAHLALLRTSEYPSAVTCGRCHPRIFTEWASSNHAYASISPMFHKFEQAINLLSSGTMGTFCVRCHQQVGTQIGEPRELPLWDRSPIAREGVTCITCHRVNAAYGKVNGERHINPGTIYEPIYNTGSAPGLDEVLGDIDYYGVSIDSEHEGTPIHAAAKVFETVGESEFCVSCHQVAVNLGIKLEVVWEQYRDSPAHDRGTTCQECHMGKVPGEAKGFDTWPVAIVNGRVVGDPNRKHSNHAFYGPGYPIAHPGIFPFNPRSLRWSIKDWLTFDYRAPWGEPEWEKALADGEFASPDFPDIWSKREDREQARYIIDQNEVLLNNKRVDRLAVMENGSRVDGPFFDDGAPTVGESFSFRYRLTNIDDGHNLPSGSLGAQPEIWMNVALFDPDGERVFESGYVDKYGDMADLHSLEVAEGTIEPDDQLFNLQTKFLTTNVKGTDREMYLPVQFDIDQLPFLRPANVPTTVLNHPPFVRMEGRSIPPLGYRDAEYTVPADRMVKKGTYRLQVRLRSRAEPIYFMKFVGATEDMEQRINEWMIDIHPYAVEFEVQ